MLRESIKTNVANATVTLLRKGGQGILVSGNLIITAAHCIVFSLEGEMGLGEYFIEEIRTSQGELKVAPLVVELVSDLAVLGSLDNQEFAKEAEDFEKFCENTKAIPLCRSDFELFRKFRVHIYTHKGTWMTGSAMLCSKDAEKLSTEADEQIEPGTSGSPIINDSGKLVGIVSNTTMDADKSVGAAPRPHLALPVWVCRQIFGSTFRD